LTAAAQRGSGAYRDGGGSLAVAAWRRQPWRRQPWRRQLGGGSLAAAAWWRRGGGGSAVAALSATAAAAWQWQLIGGSLGGGSAVATQYRPCIKCNTQHQVTRRQRGGGGREVSAHSAMAAAA
jgi:hypothetical protein